MRRVMTLPRPVIPGQTVMVTRRCTQRQFLLRPSPLVNGIVGFCLAVAARRYGVRLHAFCFLSNHVHLVVTDVEGALPEFTRWFFEFSSKCLNAHRGRWENLWSNERPSVVRLEDAEAQLRKTVYTLTNPVAAQLVSSVAHWPGLVSLPKDMGRRHVYKRPDGFFRANGPVPARAELHLEPLPGFATKGREAYVTMLSKAVAEQEEKLAEQRRAKGKGVLGRREVCRQSPTDCPQSHEPRRKLSPRVATRSRWARTEALQRLESFVTAYREAWFSRCQGAKDVLFPFGTYALRRFGGVQCHSFPP